MDRPRISSPSRSIPSYEGCIICDPFLTNMTELKQGRTKHISLVKRFHGRKKHGRKHRRNQGLF